MDAPKRQFREPTSIATTRARRLRAEATMPEKVLWNAIRSGRLGGHKFRRQHPIGGYVLDFFCEASLLAVEVDGKQHEARRERDIARDAALDRRGILTLRFTAGQVSSELDVVKATVLRCANQRSCGPHPVAARPPSPTGRGCENTHR